MRGWVHVGRLWTNGEPFLAMDAVLREGWRGGSDEDLYEERIVGLGPEVTSIPVGAGAPRFVDPGQSSHLPARRPVVHRTT